MKLSLVNNGHVDHQRLQHKTCIFISHFQAAKPTQKKKTEASQENITLIIILVYKTKKKNTIHRPLWAYKMTLFSTVKEINLNLNLESERTHLGSLVKLRGPED